MEMNITLEALWAIEKLCDNCSDGQDEKVLTAIWAILQDERVRRETGHYLDATNGSFMEFDGCLPESELDSIEDAVADINFMARVESEYVLDDCG